jgi:hypothetical protein
VGHTTIPHPAPFKLWGTVLLVVVAVAVTVLLASSLSASRATLPAGADGSTTERPAVSTPCGLPWNVARAEGLDPQSCATPREPLRTTGPR